jgi:hypothetical protein
MRIGISSTASHHVLLSKKHTFMRQRSQVYARAPERSRMVLHSRLMFWYWHLAGFWCCWCGSLCQVAMCKGWRTCLTRSLISTCVWSLMSLVGAPRWVMLSRSVLTNYLSDLIGYTSAVWVLVPTKSWAEVMPQLIAGVFGPWPKQIPKIFTRPDLSGVWGEVMHGKPSHFV